ncbi:MAG: hypothetical protein CUN52_00030 [Phototrophicales bacterium]|nr:MAG: hypothetical protein CUN52_00030 [Phototrophicales bacterium]
MSSDKPTPNNHLSSATSPLRSAVSRGGVLFLALALATALIVLGMFVLTSIEQMQTNTVITQANIDFSQRPFTIIQRHLLRLQNQLIRTDSTSAEIDEKRAFVNNSINGIGNTFTQNTLSPELRAETQAAITTWREELQPRVLEIIANGNNPEGRMVLIEDLDSYETTWSDLSTRNEVLRKAQAGELNRNTALVLEQLQNLFIAIAFTGLGLMVFMIAVIVVITRSNRQLMLAQGELQQLNRELESRVEQRTHDLQQALADAEKARASAEIANKVKSQFLASVSHELRTPLNAILNFTQFVVRGMAGDVNEEQVELLSQVTTSGEHLLGLINDVLDISKIEAGALELFIEADIDLAGELKQIASMAKMILGDKPVEFVTDIASDLPPITADRQRVFQIILNLVANACKFTDTGKVTLSAKHQPQENTLLISVADTGPGIAPEEQSLIFQNFQQTRIGMEKGGTGLGLPISSRLAEAHGGKLWVESALGAGATFFVQLPIKPAHLKPTERTMKQKEGQI